ncbi:MAG: transglycosylase SLT domain-containing protein [Candidatus Magnetoovum sp. WYHC-5]|nr:transglycosylase SLT domain-containing protein [Candidatus Magnetoovum sp. WYHC-5]
MKKIIILIVLLFVVTVPFDGLALIYRTMNNSGTEVNSGVLVNESTSYHKDRDGERNLLFNNMVNWMEPRRFYYFEGFDSSLVVNSSILELINYQADEAAVATIEEFLSIYSQRQRSVSTLLTKADEYIPVIQDILIKNGLPADLAYLPIIESGYNVNAISPKDAVGPWQFIAATAKRFDLKIDRWVDERRDPIKSTEAASRYLSYLYERFGSWDLALASYNAGEGAIERAIDRSNTENFWEISQSSHITKETKDYVPKFIAVTEIAQEPEKYGIEKNSENGANGIDGRQENGVFDYDTVTVAPPATLTFIAKTVNTTVQKIKELNPELKQDCIPPDVDSYELKIPIGQKYVFLSVYNSTIPYKRNLGAEGSSAVVEKDPVESNSNDKIAEDKEVDNNNKRSVESKRIEINNEVNSDNEDSEGQSVLNAIRIEKEQQVADVKSHQIKDVNTNNEVVGQERELAIKSSAVVDKEKKVVENKVSDKRHIVNTSKAGRKLDDDKVLTLAKYEPIRPSKRLSRSFNNSSSKKDVTEDKDTAINKAKSSVNKGKSESVESKTEVKGAVKKDKQSDVTKDKSSVSASKRDEIVKVASKGSSINSADVANTSTNINKIVSKTAGAAANRSKVSEKLDVKGVSGVSKVVVDTQKVVDKEKGILKNVLQGKTAKASKEVLPKDALKVAKKTDVVVSADLTKKAKSSTKDFSVASVASIDKSSKSKTPAKKK